MDDDFVGKFLRAWNEHDVDGAMAFMADDCIWEVTRGTEPFGTRFEGAKAVGAAIDAAFRAMPDINYDLVRSSFGANLVVLELLVSGTFADGRRARFQACDVMTMRGDRVAAKRSYRKLVE